MNELEKKLGYTFEKRELLGTALTHSSYSREANTPLPFNERLEFLGDAFFDAIIGEALFRAFPQEDEGFLSRARASIVCEKSLAEKARKLELGCKLSLGRGEEKTGGRNRDSVLADAVEAIIGAVFLDGGYDAAKAMVLYLFKDDIEDSRHGKFLIRDYKSALQEILQAEGISARDVKYMDIGQRGPDHKKVFTVRLVIEGKTEAEEEGRSKKQAQQECAKTALLRRQDAI